MESSGRKTIKKEPKLREGPIGEFCKRIQTSQGSIEDIPRRCQANIPDSSVLKAKHKELPEWNSRTIWVVARPCSTSYGCGDSYDQDGSFSPELEVMIFLSAFLCGNHLVPEHSPGCHDRECVWHFCGVSVDLILAPVSISFDFGSHLHPISFLLHLYLHKDKIVILSWFRYEHIER